MQRDPNNKNSNKKQKYKDGGHRPQMSFFWTNINAMQRAISREREMNRENNQSLYTELG